MSIKKQIPSLSKLYTIYEEVPESILDETDVDSYFYHNILDHALIDNQIVRVSKGSNKKILLSNYFNFCNLKNQQRFILEEEVSVSLKELAAILNTLRLFLKQYDKTVKFSAWYPLPKPKQEIGFTLFKDELFAHYFQDIKEHCNRQIRLSFRFERNEECCFSIEKFQIVVEQNVLTDYESTPLRSVQSSQKSILYWLKVRKFWEQLQCVAHWPLIVGMTIALLSSLETCIVQIQSGWVKFACTKRHFNLSAEPIINVRKARLCARCAIFFWRANKVLFLVVWSGGLDFWRESKVNSRCYRRCLLSWQVFFQQREMRISWWLCNNSEIHLWFWKVWSVVVCSQSSFYVTRARKDDTNRQNTQFLW